MDCTTLGGGPNLISVVVKEVAPEVDLDAVNAGWVKQIEQHVNENAKLREEVSRLKVSEYALAKKVSELRAPAMCKKCVAYEITLSHWLVKLALKIKHAFKSA